MRGILADLEAQVSKEGLKTSDHTFTPADVQVAIKRLNLHINNGLVLTGFPPVAEMRLYNLLYIDIDIVLWVHAYVGSVL